MWFYLLNPNTHQAHMVAKLRLIFCLLAVRAVLTAGEDFRPGSHWAFVPPQMPAVPAGLDSAWVRNEIDSFILARLQREGLTPAPEADRATLIRRLSFDLLGLPPTPQEVRDFLADRSAGAYESLVERMLSSSKYGERWGRYWLDVVGYADSNGYFDADSDRPLAYKYRDYVIKAFNDDKPFDRFIQEQIAGDELAGYAKGRDITPEMAELLVATHFLRNPPDGTGESDGNPDELRADRYAVLEGNVQLIGSALLGLTVQCARCHDHKFEPIAQKEYYALQAILKPIYDHDHWLKPAERVIAVGTRDELQAFKKKLDRFTRERQALEESFDGLTLPLRKLIRQQNLDPLEPSLRVALEAALNVPEKKRSESMKALLRTNAALVEISEADLLKRFPAVKPAVESLKQAIATQEKERPKPLPQIAAALETTNRPAAHHLLARGGYGSPGEPIAPGVPAILCNAKNTYAWSEDQTKATSGRRLAFARWLTSPDNPVLARLMVNRIWQQHFGQGLVATSDNFGLSGARPTHPELLDYLAVQFVRSGWSVKAIHRLIVNSATYRQSSAARNREVDPENKLLSHFEVRRLDAEAIRDAMLAVSGELDPGMNGPYIQTTRAADGQVTVDESKPGAKRRSVYLQQRRTQPATLLEVFDAPQLNPNCTRRSSSTVSLQSLALLNSEFVRARSQAFARKLLAAEPDLEQRMNLAFQSAYGRRPDEKESTAATDFFRGESAPADSSRAVDRADRAIWADFCQMLFASDAFIYVE